MEFSVLAAWLHKFLLIIGGFLIFSLLFLFSSNKNTKKKVDQMKQNDEKNLNETKVQAKACPYF